MENFKRFSEYAIECHKDTNHMYDKYLPYEFHLRMVVNVALEFRHYIKGPDVETVIAACWGHDLIEDARQSYSDVKRGLDKGGIPNSHLACEIIRAVTNYGRGRGRDERMPDFVYEDIRNVPYAKFVKLCDRIANVQYGKLTHSKMLNVYRNEQSHFQKSLECEPYYSDMWEYLKSLLNNN